MPPQSPSITSWTRLEPRNRAADLTPALEARLADPLWLLTRQWQLAELQGEDAGSPVLARIRGHRDAITRFKARDRDAIDLAAGIPLEASVERETPEDAEDLRLAAETGEALVRRLRVEGLDAAVAAFVEDYPITTPQTGPRDDATRAYLRVVAGRLPHGLDLRDDVREAGGLPAVPSLASQLRGDVGPVVDAWAAATASVISTGSEDEDAWRRDRLEYAFSVSCAGPGGETVLAAAEYDGDGLDWTDFDVAGGTLQAPAASTSFVRTVLPAPAAYAGMPSLRWWEMEDARMSFGQVGVEKTDLARLLLIEYASVYANDHFLIPIELTLGGLARVDSLVVTDTFGDRTLIPAAPAPDGWALFRPSRVDGDSEPVLVLLPTSAQTLDGEPLEEVVLQRDELANLGWAVEARVASATGHAVDRHEQEARSRAQPEPPAAGPELVYTLQTPVPPNWLPMLPVEEHPGSIRLRVVPQERRRPDGAIEPLPPLGRLLAGEDLLVPEEEVPSAAVRVTRHWQLARWTDGSTHVWLGRAKRPGRGPASSGLRFDVAETRRPQ